MDPPNHNRKPAVSQKHETLKHVVEAAPAAIAATAGPVFGITWSDLAAVLGCVFLLLQMAYLIWRWLRDVRRERRDQTPRED
jgi:ABC-type Fe3+-siderophore transport system permease subunit